MSDSSKTSRRTTQLNSAQIANSQNQELVSAGHLWLTPVILAIQEVEIRSCGSKPDQTNSSRDPISKKLTTKKELAELLKW
jgi:hypothetical protein